MVVGLKAGFEKVVALRNNYAPINRLPPEIICEIFLQLAIHCYRLSDKTYLHGCRTVIPGKDPYAWIVVTHVCRYWRSTALHFPKLWTLISRKQVDIVRAFVSRSGQAPLDIVEHPSDQNAHQVMKILLEESDRWRTLELSATHCSWDQLPRSAPSLEVLRLNSWSSQVDSNSLSFELPRLRSVYLVHSPFSLVERIVKRDTITNLILINITHTQAPATWAGVLRSMPFLEELQLKDAIQSIYPAPHSQRASLPRLRSLNLVESNRGGACAALLGMLTFPCSTRIYYGNVSDSTDDQSLYLLQAVLINLTGGSSDLAQVPTLHTCRIDCPYRSGRGSSVSIYIWTDELSLDDFSFNSTPKPLISLQWGTEHPWDAFGITKTFLDVFPLSQLRILYVVGLLSCAVTQEHHAKLRNVRALYVDYLSEDTLEGDAELLYPSVDEGVPLPFPNLDRLAFRALPWHEHPLGHPGHSAEDVTYDVRGMLIRRQAAGLSLKSLNIHVGLNVDPDEVAALMNDGLVEKATITGKRRGEEEYKKRRSQSWRHTQK